jgi:type VI secretion system protein ImpF
MPRDPLEDEAPLRMSILDRLLDDDPEQAVERPLSRRKQIELIKEGLRRDLEMLLNTRRRYLLWPDDLPELTYSLANFGLRDVSFEDVHSEAFRQQFLVIMRDAIDRLEPRVRALEITLAPARDQGDTLIRFRIRGQVQLHQGLEPILFETSLEPVQRLVMVRGEA